MERIERESVGSSWEFLFSLEKIFSPVGGGGGGGVLWMERSMHTCNVNFIRKREA